MNKQQLREEVARILFKEFSDNGDIYYYEEYDKVADTLTDLFFNKAKEMVELDKLEVERIMDVTLGSCSLLTSGKRFAYIVSPEKLAKALCQSSILKEVE